MAESGVKHDDDKLRWDLLPVNALQAIIEVMMIGAKKYSPDNWKHVPDKRTRYYNATMRHLTAWWAGELRDPETGKSHLAHAGCNVLFLLWFQITGRI